MPERLDLVEARRLRGYTQEYMAEKLSVSRSTYANMEKRPYKCSIENAEKICAILEFPAERINFFNIISTKCGICKFGNAASKKS